MQPNTIKKIYITATGERIDLKVLRKNSSVIEYVEDTGVAEISAAEWLEAVLEEIGTTSADPRRALDAVLQAYRQEYPKGFDRLPLSKADVDTVLVYFEDLRQQAKIEGNENDYWCRCSKYNEKRVLRDLETTLAKVEASK